MTGSYLGPGLEKMLNWRGVPKLGGEIIPRLRSASAHMHSIKHRNGKFDRVNVRSTPADTERPYPFFPPPRLIRISTYAGNGGA